VYAEVAVTSNKEKWTFCDHELTVHSFGNDAQSVFDAIGHQLVRLGCKSDSDKVSNVTIRCEIVEFMRQRCHVRQYMKERLHNDEKWKDKEVDDYISHVAENKSEGIDDLGLFVASLLYKVTIYIIRNGERSATPIGSTSTSTRPVVIGVINPRTDKEHYVSLVPVEGMITAKHAILISCC